MIYTMNGMATRAQPAGRRARHLPRPVRALQRRRLLRHALRGRARCRPTSSKPGSRTTRAAERRARHGRLHGADAAERRAAPAASSAQSTADLFDRIVEQAVPPGTGARARAPADPRSEKMTCSGKLSWSAIPFDQPIPLLSAAVVGLVLLGTLAWVTVKGLLAVSVEGVDHQRRPQAHRHHVHRARAGDAAARLRPTRS